MQARYVFQLEDLFQCLQFNELTAIFCVNLNKIMKLYKKRAVLTCQFDVSKLQKQLRSVIQIHSDQSDNFGLLPLNVSVTVSHNVVFNNINR